MGAVRQNDSHGELELAAKRGKRPNVDVLLEISKQLEEPGAGG